MNGLARCRVGEAPFVVATVGVFSLLLAACPSASGPSPRPGEVETPAGPTEPPIRLSVIDHWARCEPGLVGPRTLVTHHGAGEPTATALTPGQVALVSRSAAEVLSWRVVEGPAEAEAALAASGEVPAVGEPAAVTLGCSPHALRTRALAALVLAAPAETDVTVEVAGLEVAIPAGARHVLHLPRGTHAVVRPSSDGCATTRAAIPLDGAGSVVRLGPCDLGAPIPL